MPLWVFHASCVLRRFLAWLEPTGTSSASVRAVCSPLWSLWLVLSWMRIVFPHVSWIVLCSLVEGNLCRSLHLSVGVTGAPVTMEQALNWWALLLWLTVFSWSVAELGLEPTCPGSKLTLLSSLPYTFVFSPDHMRSQTLQEERNLCDHKGHLPAPPRPSPDAQIPPVPSA